jgi:hypothetical protein
MAFFEKTVVSVGEARQCAVEAKPYKRIPNQTWERHTSITPFPSAVSSVWAIFVPSPTTTGSGWFGNLCEKAQ